jgi:5'-3' exonuclease
VVARNLHDRATRAGRRHAERVPVTLHDEHRQLDVVELVQATLGGRGPGAARRLQRERKAEHRHGTGFLRGPAGHARAQRAAADDQRQPAQLPAAEVIDDRRPGDVELARGRGRAAPGNAVGLLDERDADALRTGDVRHRHQVSGIDPSTGAVAEDQGGAWLIGEVQVDVRPTMRRLHFEHRHGPDLDSTAHTAVVVRPLLLVDAPFLLYRAFYALPKTIKGKDEMPVGALLGSVNAILSAADEHSARAVVCCFGPDAAAYRVELFPRYHAHRPPMPAELARQWVEAPKLYTGLGWHVAISRELEADDLLGSYAATEAEAGGEAIILTGDRDLFQCAGERVKVLLAGKGGAKVVDAKGVEERYGVPPALVPDFIALRGDPSDGLPGARGVGEKTAADILSRRGSLEAALEAAAEGTSIAGARDELRAFKEIATLRRVEVERPDDAPTDSTAGAAAARELGMAQLAKRLEARS